MRDPGTATGVLSPLRLRCLHAKDPARWKGNHDFARIRDLADQGRVERHRQSLSLIPFVGHLPLSVQRTLSFLPLPVDPVAQASADLSTEWRLQMWKNVLPQIPQYLWLGKGYSISAADLLEGTEKARKQEAAKYQRDRRRKLTDQKKAIKEKLRVPAAQLLAEAEVEEKRIRAERSANSLSRGMYMSDAPTGKGLLVSGGYNSVKIGVIGGALTKAESSSPERTVEDCNYWPISDRRNVKPQGTGADIEDSPSGYLTGGMVPKARKGFQVKLNNFDLDRIVRGLVSTYCARTDQDAYLCRLCHVYLDSLTEARMHFEKVHGDEWEKRAGAGKTSYGLTR